MGIVCSFYFYFYLSLYLICYFSFSFYLICSFSFSFSFYYFCFCLCFSNLYFYSFYNDYRSYLYCFLLSFWFLSWFCTTLLLYFLKSTWGFSLVSLLNFDFDTLLLSWLSPLFLKKTLSDPLLLDVYIYFLINCSFLLRFLVWFWVWVWVWFLD